MRLGVMIQTCRERAGLSQERLAELIHRSRSCISKFETDKRLPDIPTFMQIMTVTNAREAAAAILFGVDAATIMQKILPFIGG